LENLIVGRTIAGSTSGKIVFSRAASRSVWKYPRGIPLAQGEGEPVQGHPITSTTRLSLSFYWVGVLALLSFWIGGAFFGPRAASAHTGCPLVYITGTGSNDHLYGDGGDPNNHDHLDSIDGRGGDDYIEGYSCVDDLYGGLGSDEMHGGYGNDDVYGEQDDDGAPNTTGGLYLGNGADYGEGGGGYDFVGSNETTAGSDFLGGGQQNDTLNGVDGNFNDTIHGEDGTQDFCYYDGSFGPDDNIDSSCETAFPE